MTRTSTATPVDRLTATRSAYAKLGREGFVSYDHAAGKLGRPPLDPAQAAAYLRDGIPPANALDLRLTYAVAGLREGLSERAAS